MIGVKELRFTYPRSTGYALSGIDFTVDRGEVFGLLGPSGAGKTTTQNILIGLLKTYEGSATVDGREMRDIGPDYYERIGVAFDSPNLYTKFTALENLTFFQSLYSGPTEDPVRLLEEVGLEDAASAMVSSLSHGMKMRLRLCRALIGRPELLFLDEPTSGLDPVNARKVRDLIGRCRSEGTTVILSTHDMITADEICDRVAFIVDGSIGIIDSPRNLRLQKGDKRVTVEYRDDQGKTASRVFPLHNLQQDDVFSGLLRDQRVETIHTIEPTLEDIFVEVTGRRLK